MTDEVPDPLPDDEIRALLDGLFPRGVAGQDVVDEIAPEGWERSPFPACFDPASGKQDEQVTELVGACLWDIVSDNHDMVMPGGRPVTFGSFRQSAWHIADHVMKDRGGVRGFDHMLYYMGTVRFERDADLTPVYAMIFRRLAALGWDWAYTYPQLYLVEIPRPGADAPPPPDDIDEADTRPGRVADDRDAPATVRAYQKVYGRDPRGWPM